MAVHKMSPIISLKGEKEDGRFMQFSIDENLASKLSNLNLQAREKKMSTNQVQAKDMLPSGFTEKFVTNEYIDSTLNFLKSSFFKDEPLNIAVELISEQEDSCKELEEYCIETIKEGHSIIVLNPDNEIVAAGLFGLCNRNDSMDDFSEGCDNPRFKKILQLLYKVAVESDFFGKCPDLDSALDVKILAVGSSCRGQGLGHYLLHKAIEIAKSAKAQAIMSECSSIFTGKIMKKLGSTKIYELKYEDYKSNGKPIFNPPAPHDKVTVYYYRL